MYVTTKNAINAALKVIGLAGMVGVTVVAPNATQGLSLLLKKSQAKKANHERILAELKRQNLVHVRTDGDEQHYGLTPNGIHRLQQVIVDELIINMPKRWDKKWRLVSFDIPVKFSRPRAAFVVRLKGLGFFMIQKSVWVHPAPCFTQVEQLAGHYNVLRYCALWEVNRLDEQTTRKLLRHFSEVIHT